MKKLISIIIPVYNEEKNAPLIYIGLLKILKSLEKKYKFEIIFVNDGSTDDSGEAIERIIKSSKRAKGIEFSRNFGKEVATTAGIKHSSGDAVIIIDSDLQHPVEIIPEFIKKWEQGIDVVIGVRKNGTGGVLKKTGSFFFYKIMNLISETPIVPNETDFRIIDRVVADAFDRFTERQRLTRGLIDWLGFKRDYIFFTASKRQNGTPSYSKAKLLRLAFSSFIANSLFPLKIAGYLGMLIVSVDGFLGLFVFIERFVLGDPLQLHFSGPAILAIINIFLIGIVLSCLGLIALYIGKIDNEVTNRPMYVIRKKLNLK